MRSQSLLPDATSAGSNSLRIDATPYRLKMLFGVEEFGRGNAFIRLMYASATWLMSSPCPAA